MHDKMFNSISSPLDASIIVSPTVTMRVSLHMGQMIRAQQSHPRLGTTNLRSCLWIWARKKQNKRKTIIFLCTTVILFQIYFAFFLHLIWVVIGFIISLLFSFPSFFFDITNNALMILFTHNLCFLPSL